MEPVLVEPAPDAHAFTVGGVVYTQTDGLSVARLSVFQRYGLEFGQDMRLRDVQSALAAVKAEFNAGKFFDAVHQLGKLMDGYDYVGANRLRDVELCALYYNAPGEDPGTYDFQAMQAKIAAWGAVHGGFFMRRALFLLSAPYGPYSHLPAETEEAPDSPATPPLPND